MLRQHEATLNQEFLAEWFGSDGVELLVREAKVGKARVVGMVHDQLLQLSGHADEGGWRTLTGVGVVRGVRGVRGHVVLSQGGCVLGVFAGSCHLEVGGRGKLGQTHDLWLSEGDAQMTMENTC